MARTKVRWRRFVVFAVLAFGIVFMHSITTAHVSHAATAAMSHDTEHHDASCPGCGGHQHSHPCIGSPVIPSPFVSSDEPAVDAAVPMSTAPRTVDGVVDNSGRDPPQTHSRSQLQIWRV